MPEKLRHVPGCSCCDVVGDARCEDLRKEKKISPADQPQPQAIRPPYVYKPQAGGWANPAMED